MLTGFLGPKERFGAVPNPGDAEYVRGVQDMAGTDAANVLARSGDVEPSAAEAAAERQRILEADLAEMQKRADEEKRARFDAIERERADAEQAARDKHQADLQRLEDELKEHAAAELAAAEKQIDERRKEMQRASDEAEAALASKVDNVNKDEAGRLISEFRTQQKASRDALEKDAKEKKSSLQAKLEARKRKKREAEEARRATMAMK